MGYVTGHGEVQGSFYEFCKGNKVKEQDFHVFWIDGTQFREERFYFGAEDFWSNITSLAERFVQDLKTRKMNGVRGSKHFLYMNRTCLEFLICCTT